MSESRSYFFSIVFSNNTAEATMAALRATISVILIMLSFPFLSSTIFLSVPHGMTIFLPFLPCYPVILCHPVPFQAQSFTLSKTSTYCRSVSLKRYVFLPFVSCYCRQSLYLNILFLIFLVSTFRISFFYAFSSSPPLADGIKSPALWCLCFLLTVQRYGEFLLPTNFSTPFALFCPHF